MSTIEIYSPLPGIFYRSPSPDKPPFAVDGQSVEADTVIGLIEVMKQFSEVLAEQSGSNIQFLIANGADVEPGQLIATLEII